MLPNPKKPTLMAISIIAESGLQDSEWRRNSSLGVAWENLSETLPTSPQPVGGHEEFSRREPTHYPMMTHRGQRH
jgi:hypothetical protein